MVKDKIKLNARENSLGKELFKREKPFCYTCYFINNE